MQFSTLVITLFFSVFMSLFVAAAPLEERSINISGEHSGDGTYYATGLGACGIWNNDDDHIVAVGHDLFDNYPGYTGTNPNANPICNKKLTANYNGKSVTVTVVDRCVGCGPWDLDFSPAAFTKLAPESVGRLESVEWSFD
ncbi:uncharacterized protein PHACADRAFT_259886 [Phanerochaete carnosa HHB-10118-sp]|uniref:RlpA-like protein double-psi beta-barrel domain-containing protein n=1 Tax=Phanerochaete carnosa (strain HHB-10118-sp) TaxID=650164 RepID=K5UU16_PHACS|nr:uncharacterized protein PHACADRAFT_259886 [Phanerochaete carnosa HHB-10118-sp]EKM53476.1 hypothetical protein PHACADRAFT_259886 [Phanerochaete carnosa HHB-10118-sp]